MAIERSSEHHFSRALRAPFPVPRRTNLLREVGLDFLLVCASYVGAHLLRFGGELPRLPHAAAVLPAIGLVKVAVFSQFQLYRTVWTHAGTPDAVRLTCASTAASAGLLLGAMVLRAAGLVPAAGSAPIALLVIDWLLATIAAGGRRFGCRAFNQYGEAHPPGRTRILIYGADAWGILSLRHLRRVLPAHTSVVGFVDPEQNGLQLRGRPVVDRSAALDADALIVPLPPPPSDHDFTQNRIQSIHDRFQIIDDSPPMDIPCHLFKPTIEASSPASVLKKAD